jgi:hypothetical protein
VFKEIAVPLFSKTSAFVPSPSPALSAHNAEQRVWAELPNPSAAGGVEGLSRLSSSRPLPVASLAKKMPLRANLQALAQRSEAQHFSAATTSTPVLQHQAMQIMTGGVEPRGKDQSRLPKAAENSIFLGTLQTDAPHLAAVFAGMPQKKMFPTIGGQSVGNLIAGRLGPLKSGVFTDCIRLGELKKALGPETRMHAASILKCLNNLVAVLPESHKDKIDREIALDITDNSDFQAHLAAYASAARITDVHLAIDELLRDSPTLAKALNAVVDARHQSTDVQQTVTEFLLSIHPLHGSAAKATAAETLS